MNPYQHFEQKTPKSYPFQFTKFTMNPYQHLTQMSTKSHKKTNFNLQNTKPNFHQHETKNHSDRHTPLCSYQPS